MTRGQAQHVVPPATVVVFPDGGSYLTSQVHDEADRALEEAASAAYVDVKRAEFDRAVDEHCARFGFDTPVNRYDTKSYSIGTGYFGLCELCDFETEWNLSVLYIIEQMRVHVERSHPGEPT